MVQLFVRIPILLVRKLRIKVIQLAIRQIGEIGTVQHKISQRALSGNERLKKNAIRILGVIGEISDIAEQPSSGTVRGGTSLVKSNLLHVGIVEPGQQTGGAEILVSIIGPVKATMVEIPAGNHRYIVIAVKNEVRDIAQNVNGRPYSRYTCFGISDVAINGIVNAGQEPRGGIIARLPADEGAVIVQLGVRPLHLAEDEGEILGR